MSDSGQAVERFALAPDLSISRIATGLWQVADLERGGRELDLDRAAEALSPYVEAGLTTFDMADHYGSAEEIVGRRRAGDGPPVEALTKWVPSPGPVPPERARAAVERARRRLGGAPIDLLQLHAWAYDDPAYLDALEHLTALREAGAVRHLGLTNFDTSHLRLVVESGTPVVSNQVCLSLLDRRPLGRMLPFCRERGLGVLAYGTLAGGLLSDRWLGAPEPGAEELDTWSLQKYKRFVDAAGGWNGLQTVLAALDRVARRRSASIANVACRWVLDQPAVASILVGARLTRSEHVEETLRVLALELDDADHAELSAAAEALRPIPGDSGDEYRRPPFLTAAGDLSDHFDEMPPPYPVESGPGGRRCALSGTAWEGFAGYSRAVRQGDRIVVSGTTATHGGRLVGGADPEAQAVFVLDKIEGALRSLGGRLDDVVRTRVYVADRDDWEVVARAHGRRFAAVRPANTLVEARLIGDAYRVEIEAEAIVGAS